MWRERVIITDTKTLTDILHIDDTTHNNTTIKHTTYFPLNIQNIYFPSINNTILLALKACVSGQSGISGNYLKGLKVAIVHEKGLV